MNVQFYSYIYSYSSENQYVKSLMDIDFEKTHQLFTIF
ncbi:MAG: hypothetical protein ACI9SD_001406 [Pseudohongiellaceae bacterium]|jgi:hypothetical protein